MSGQRPSFSRFWAEHLGVRTVRRLSSPTNSLFYNDTRGHRSQNLDQSSLVHPMSVSLASLQPFFTENVYNTEFAAARAESTPDGAGAVFVFRPLTGSEFLVFGEGQPRILEYQMSFAGCVREIGRETEPDLPWGPVSLVTLGLPPNANATARELVDIAERDAAENMVPSETWWGPSSEHRRSATVSVVYVSSDISATDLTLIPKFLPSVERLALGAFKISGGHEIGRRRNLERNSDQGRSASGQCSIYAMQWFLLTHLKSHGSRPELDKQSHVCGTLLFLVSCLTVVFKYALLRWNGRKSALETVNMDLNCHRGEDTEPKCDSMPSLGSVSRSSSSTDSSGNDEASSGNDEASSGNDEANRCYGAEGPLNDPTLPWHPTVPPNVPLVREWLEGIERVADGWTREAVPPQDHRIWCLLARRQAGTNTDGEATLTEDIDRLSLEVMGQPGRLEIIGTIVGPVLGLYVAEGGPTSIVATADTYNAHLNEVLAERKESDRDVDGETSRMCELLPSLLWRWTRLAFIGAVELDTYGSSHLRSGDNWVRYFSGSGTDRHRPGNVISATGGRSLRNRIRFFGASASCWCSFLSNTMPMPKLYPDKRVNPTAANFKSKTPVEVSRLPPDFKERILDAAKVFCVPVRVVVEAIENITDDDLGLDALFQKPDLFAVGFLPFYQICTHDDGKATNTKTDMRRATKTFAPTEGRRTRSTMKVADKSVVQQMNIRATRRTANTLRVKTSKGRAICRIVHPYFESYTAIGIIFGSTHLPVMRAIDNIYGDDKSRDFKEAGEDFKKAFPPIEEETSASKPSGTSLKR
ncbi:hypothetical protein C8R43DRAFT_955698 [Mycena crocata]|nr:hypothetical protein C8R43DRAFT_955698 [Mycena crocata]